MKNSFFLGVMALMFVSFQSCRKMQDSDSDAETKIDNNLKAAITEVISNAVNEISLQDVHGICVDKYNGFGHGIRIYESFTHGHVTFKIPLLSACATITESDSVYPKEIIIDYGSQCIDFHHHTISGKILIHISDSLRHPGAIRTVVSQDLFIDSVSVQLNTRYENLGLNTDYNRLILSISDQTVTLEDGTVLTQTSQDTIEWISGFESIDKKDDIFYKSGSGMIHISGSLIYSRTMTTPLLYDRSCPAILRGTVSLYKDGSTVIIDYGEGTCDNVATVTTNGITEEINIRSHLFNEHGRFEKHRHGFGDGLGYGHGNKGN